MKKPTEKRRNQILAKAARDLGEPVVPIAVVCAAFSTWGKASGRNAWPTNFEAMKSNLLYRLIYLREPLREEKCPKHQGRWSGCAFGTYCDCQKIINPADGLVYYDSNVTGWLLDGNPEITGPCGSMGRVQADGSPLEYEPYDGYESGKRAIMRESDIFVTCEQLSGHAGACDHGHDWNRA
jgi:hypothetical protein